VGVLRFCFIVHTMLWGSAAANGRRKRHATTSHKLGMLLAVGAMLATAGKLAAAFQPSWLSITGQSACGKALRAPRAEVRDLARGRSRVARRNWLEMLEDAAGSPTPVAPKVPIPSTAAPLHPPWAVKELTAFELEEKGLSMSGEDFEVKSPTGEVLLRIGGGNRLPIPGMPVWDKLTMTTADGAQIGSLDRQAFAMTATYDLNRADGSKFGRISKSMFAFTSSFELWQEGDGQAPLLKAEGSFSDKSYVMKCHEGSVVATVTRLKGFSGGNVDNYNVIVAPGVDASLVLAMAVVIDEIHDEENPDNESGKESLPEMLAGASGLPMPQAPSHPIPDPARLLPLDSALLLPTASAYELEEKGLSMSGEDFEVKSPTGQVILRISGGNRLPIAGMPVWDRLEISTGSGTQIAILDREMVAMTPTYDVLRPDGSKFGKIDKAMFSGFTETFDFYLEGDDQGPILKASGSFNERKYEIKSRDGLVVATVGKGYFQTDSENRYHVVVGPKVDATMVIALAFVIDEVHDEEDRKEGKGDGGGGFNPFR